MSIAEVLTSRFSDTCYYCGVKHAQVEAEGMLHCPNLICPGPGASWFRHTLPSFKECSDGRHIVDKEEWLKKAMEYEKSPENKYGKFIYIPNTEQEMKGGER